MKSRYRTDAQITIRVIDIMVTIDDDDDTKSHEEKLREAVGEELNDRLVILDHRGARGGADGCVISHGVERVYFWERTE